MSKTPGVVAVVLAVAALTSCGRRNDHDGCPRLSADARCSDDTPECRLAHLLAGRGSLASLREVVLGDPPTLDEAYRALFPAIAGKQLADDVLPVPADLTVHINGFADRTIATPLDWTTDPYAHPSWQLFYQTLEWLTAYYDPAKSAADADVGAYVLVDWAERVLYADPPLPRSWQDAGMWIRLRAALTMFDRYVATHDVLDRRVVAAAAQIAMTQIYGNASPPPCYSSTG